MGEQAMTLQEALYALGVRDNTLTEQEKDKLDADGYLPLTDILSPEEIAGIRAASEKLYAIERTGEKEGPAECSYMQNKALGFDICFTHPRVLAAISHVLQGDFKSFGIHGRPHPPGGEQQALHVDYNGPPAKPGKYAVCNSLWMLVDFTEDNGATRVVPGTHLGGRHPQDALADPAASHPRQRQLLGRAGTVAVFNSHVWHGTTQNRSRHDRRSLTSFFCRRDDPHMVFSSALSAEAAARLSEAARCLFADPEPWTG
jgi:hypothetical protein